MKKKLVYYDSLGEIWYISTCPIGHTFTHDEYDGSGDWRCISGAIEENINSIESRIKEESI